MLRGYLYKKANQMINNNSNYIYDISIPLNKKTINWPGDPQMIIEECSSIKSGHEANVSQISLGAHTGTHIDAPHHFLNNSITTDKISLDILIGTCMVIDINSKNTIEIKDIEHIDFSNISRVLFKTKNSLLWESPEQKFNKKFISLGLSAAEFLLEEKVKLIGIDYLSIESYYAGKGNPVHKILLKNNIVILEGLNLHNIEEGIYELTCLPLKLIGIEGSPARAILKKI